MWFISARDLTDGFVFLFNLKFSSTTSCRIGLVVLKPFNVFYEKNVLECSKKARATEILYQTTTTKLNPKGLGEYGFANGISLIDGRGSTHL